MPSAEIAVQVNDLEFGNFLERIESSDFSDPSDNETSSASDEITFTESPGQVHQNTITNEHSRPAPNWVPQNVLDLLLDLKTYVESHTRVPEKPYIFTWPDFGSENEDIILGKI
jgi:hypothetical protein